MNFLRQDKYLDCNKNKKHDCIYIYIYIYIYICIYVV